jgi:hypothetical protein
MRHIKILAARIITLVVLTSFTNTGLAEQAEHVNVPVIPFKTLSAGDSVLNDVYVKLYLARFRRAKLAIEREKQELITMVKWRDRAEALYRSHAVSAEELEDKRKLVEIAAIRVQEAEASAEEAETFVDIAVSRISIGLEMPICAEIR